MCVFGGLSFSRLPAGFRILIPFLSPSFVRLPPSPKNHTQTHPRSQGDADCREARRANAHLEPQGVSSAKGVERSPAGCCPPCSEPPASTGVPENGRLQRAHPAQCL
ncbi:hypothetical protein DQ04_08521010 [Trypanosoma grayi]|uniref:hypothetical protein n=1 Tax=Trypanosoma grayi TaxID=71804 RepID=UPI0004F41975|nr:hypothetical protein DQ04_08521010 [Trypanosoma grayi]KEG07901.1 hypothetical protein DQ04_08521010 [Trypanosoma grayi]